jgi:endogenous inhibitor of DNA gyrase (YacG/DUF329 family)
MLASGKSKCPTCEEECERDNKFFPFCSERCQLLDLWNWFNGEYAFSEPLPNVEEDPEESEPFWRN